MTWRAGRVLALAGALALPTGTSALAAELTCAEAAAQVERSAALPAGLLLAIGQVESGRLDAAGRLAPWPWTVQGGGVGRYLDTAADALAAVRHLQAEGIQSIDIGCFQMNLFYHPDAFADPASGFDPLTNALAAAHFLQLLHDELGSWEDAVAAYHSRTAALGSAYRDQVLAAWHTPAGRLAATLAHAPVAFGVHVWGPTGSLQAGAAAAPAWLPRVIIPHLAQKLALP